ncbi:hypothetical protein C0991_007146 [Blastosporella zonata]|nr:hypothetical protein C0991_007146 [Blastosporella zonata]
MAQVQHPGNQVLVSLATQAVFLSLHHYGLAFAFSGMVAQTIYGEAHHLPEGIEISLFSPLISITALEEALARTYPTWFTCHPLSRRLQYVNLTLAAQGSMSNIEIVFVPTSGLTDYLKDINGLPVVPYSFILLRELMLWDTTSPENLQSRRSHEDNILRMLNVLRRRPDFVHHSQFDESTQAASRGRVTRYFAVHPSFRKEWQRLGLIPHRDRAPDGGKVLLGRHEVREVSATQGSPLTKSEDLVASLEKMSISPGPSIQSEDPSHSNPAPTPHEAAPASKKKPKLGRLQVRRLAARTTFEVLKAHGFHCALFGSMACKLYGNKRIPNDIDILVLPQPSQLINGLAPTQETLKDLLVASAPESFVLRPARDPEATYRVLYFLPTPTSKPTPHHASKVDILLPGAMSLPALPLSQVWWRPNPFPSGSPGSKAARRPHDSEPEPKVPVLPFAVLLMHKLQGWDDHRRARETRYKDKAPVDVEDLEWMLSIGVSGYLRVDPRRGAMIWRDRALFDEEFEARSKERVLEFSQELAHTLRLRHIHFAFYDDIATYTYGITRWFPRSIKIMICLGELNLQQLSESISSESDGRLKGGGSPGALTFYTTGRRDGLSHSISVQLVPTNRHPLHSGSFVVDGIPLVPFTFVLLELLEEWDRSDPGSSAGKQKVVMSMLRYLRSNLSQPYCKPIRYFDPVLHAESQDRVSRFYEVRASYLPEWKRMGFLTPDWKPSSDADGLEANSSVIPSMPSTELANLFATSLTVSSIPPAPSHISLPSVEISSEIPQPQSKSLFVKCPPRLLELLHNWDTDPAKKEDSSREIEAFLISIRMGRQTLVTGPRPVLDSLVHAQVHRYFTENKALFLQWQKMGFFGSYASKYDVPPAPPKSDRGYSGMCAIFDAGVPPSMSTISPLTFGLLVLCRFMTGAGANAGICSAINSTSKSFPDKAVRVSLGYLITTLISTRNLQRGVATGIVISGIGLSAFLFSTISRWGFAGDTSSFLRLLSLGSSIPMIVGFFFVKPIPLPPAMASDHEYHPLTNMEELGVEHSPLLDELPE